MKLIFASKTENLNISKNFVHYLFCSLTEFNLYNITYTIITKLVKHCVYDHDHQISNADPHCVTITRMQDERNEDLMK